MSQKTTDTLKLLPGSSQFFDVSRQRRAGYVVLFLAVILTVSTACVSIDHRLQLVSSAHASSDTLQHCATNEVTSVPTPILSASPGLDPENISLLNWNIHKGYDEDWQQDLSRFASEHNVMTLQEATLDPEMVGLIEAQQKEWVMNRAFRLNGVAAGVMTVADNQAIYSCGFKNDEPFIRIPKATLIGYYDIDGSDERLLVANIHGINFTLGMEDYRQQIEDLYLAVKRHDGPMIIAGDFNSWSSVRMAEVESLVEKLGLSDLEYQINNRTHVLGNAIDHVFYRGLEVVDNRVWEVTSSDHNPISVNFRYRT